MADFVFKVKMLLIYLLGSTKDWRSEVWSKDPDSLYCCDGRECACGGLTVREMHSHIFAPRSRNEQ